MSKLCKDCGARDKAKGRSRCWPCYVARRDGKPTPRSAPAGPRILALDIETSPNLAYVWGLWDQNVGLNQIESVTEMLCFAAKWVGEDGIHFHSQHHDGHGDMVQAAWDLLNEADVLMHWNGKSFDTKHLNREFLLAGLTPPSPYKQLDLLAAVRSRFRFPSNKLEYVSTALGLAGKVKHEGFELWRKCLAGDPAAWAKMQEYNEQDVVLLEELLEILRPWVPGLPHHHLYNGTGCPACGGDVVEDGVYRTPLSMYPQYRCLSCGFWSRGSSRIGGVKIQAAAL